MENRTLLSFRSGHYVTKVRPGVLNSTSSGTIAIEVAVQLGTIAAIEMTRSSGKSCNSEWVPYLCPLWFLLCFSLSLVTVFVYLFRLRLGRLINHDLMVRVWPMPLSRLC